MEDDPVVREIDVVLSKALLKKLFVLQYPLCPTYREMKPIVEARIRPRHQILEVTQKIEKDDNYDFDAKPPLNCQKFVLSSRLLVAKAHYCVGIYRDNKLHLTPVHRILQMTPSFQYIDDAQRVEAAATAAPKEIEPETVQPIQVKFKRREKKDVESRRKAGYAYKLARQEADTWLSLGTYDRYSAEAGSAFEKLAFADDNLDDAMEIDYPNDIDSGGFRQQNANRQGYLKCISSVGAASAKASSPPPQALKTDPNEIGKADIVSVPVTNAFQGSFQVRKSADTKLSLQGLKNIAPELRVNEIMRFARVARFQQVVTLIESVLPTNEVLRLISECSVLVQGNWVYKSSLCYPNKNQKYYADIRDLLLLHFRESLWVSRTAIKHLVVIHDNNLKRIFQDVATLIQPERVWQLKQPRDDKFLALYGEIAEIQNNLWENRKQELLDHLKHIKVKGLQPPTFTNNKNDRRRNARSSRKRVIRNGPSAIKSSITSDVGKPTNILESSIVQLFLSDSKVGSIATQGKILGSLGELMKTAGNLRDFVKSECENGKISSQLMERSLKSVAVKIDSCKHIAETLWILKRRGGGEFDEFRMVIVELFRRNAKVKRRMVREAIMKSLGPEKVAIFSQGTTYSRLMNEIANSSGSVWTIKQ